MKRRTFLRSTAAAAISSTAFSTSLLARTLAAPLRALPDTPYLDNIGLQLWTVRNEIAMDKEVTIRLIAEAGYKQVEMSNPLGSDDIVKLATDNGLAVTSSFFNWKTLVTPDADDVPAMGAVIEKASQIGLKYLVFGYVGRGHRESADEFKELADAISVAGEKCNAAGIQLCYHNHAFEFVPLEDEVCGYEILMERTHRDYVKFELDVFWAQIAGWDALETLKKLEGRVAQVHLKDLKANTEQQFDEGKVPEAAFQELGNGIIDMGKVLGLAKSMGVEQCHVEQDQSPNPIKSIGISRKFLDGVKVVPPEEEPAAGEHKHVHGHDHEHDDPFKD